ncbi:hypothetical protein RSAG8_12597, partial [Rhizoctonia solani AG-8 WAC10335]
MIFEKMGLSAWVTDSNGNQLSEYQVQETADDTIQCWIPSTQGTNFEIHYHVRHNPHPKSDLCFVPFLDGVQMSGFAPSNAYLSEQPIGKLYRHRIGNASARLYEFGTRMFTDRDDVAKPDQTVLKSLNTIKLVFEWGHRGNISEIWDGFHDHREIGPIHEKAAKKGHSGAAKLGKTINLTTSSTVHFATHKHIKPVTFIFCYAPEDWLRARDIVPRSPEPEPQEARGTQKRERSATPSVVDIDELETDDDEIQIVKHMIPASVTNNKRQRTEKRGSIPRPKNEED